MNEKETELKNVILALRPPLSEFRKRKIESITAAEVQKIEQYARELSNLTEVPLPEPKLEGKQREHYWVAVLLQYLRRTEKKLIDSLRPRYLDQLAKGQLAITPEKLKHLQAYSAILGDYMDEAQNQQVLNTRIDPKTPDEQMALAKNIAAAEVVVSAQILRENLKDFSHFHSRAPQIRYRSMGKERSTPDALTLFGFDVGQNPTFAQIKRQYVEYQKQFQPILAAATRDEKLIAEAELASKTVSAVWTTIKTQELYDAFLEARASQLDELSADLDQIQDYIKLLHKIFERTRIVAETREEIPDYYLLLRANFEKQPTLIELKERIEDSRNMIGLFYIHPELHKKVFLELHELHYGFVACGRIFSDPERKARYDAQYRSSTVTREATQASTNTTSSNPESNEPNSPELQTILDEIERSGLSTAPDINVRISRLTEVEEKKRARAALSLRFEEYFGSRLSTWASNIDKCLSSYEEIDQCLFLSAAAKKILLLRVNEQVVRHFEGKFSGMFKSHIAAMKQFGEQKAKFDGLRDKLTQSYVEEINNAFRQIFIDVTIGNIKSNGHVAANLAQIWEFYRSHRALVDGKEDYDARFTLRESFAETAAQNFRTSIARIRIRDDYERVEKELSQALGTFFSGGHRFFNELRKELTEVGSKLQR